MDETNREDYVARRYRSRQTASDLRYFNIQIRESDLAIGVDRQSYQEGLPSLVRKALAGLRGDLEDYIFCHPEFRTSLVPVRLLPAAPQIVRIMAQAGRASNVGPMAAVAGAIAQGVGEMLSREVREVIVENGGDIYIRTLKERVIAVFAGSSSFTYRLGIRVSPNETPLGICTSSGTVGPSLSFGQADAVVIKAQTAALADAAASRAGNMVQSIDDLVKAIDAVKNIAGIKGVLVVKGDNLAAWGDMELAPL